MPTSSAEKPHDRNLNTVERALLDIGARISDNRATVLNALALAGIFVFAFAHSAQYAGAIIDDAFITFRHALNIVEGHGFTCNPNERIEGTSSFLLTLISVLPIGLGADPLLFAKTLGSLSFSGCALAAYGSVRYCLSGRLGNLLGLLAAVCVAASAPLAFHSQTGLEAVFYAFLVAFGLMLYFAKFVAGASSRSRWAVVMGLAAITRPEGAIFFVILFVPAMVRSIDIPSLRPALRRDALFFFVVFGTIFLFRVLYFGTFLPNTVIAKSGTPLGLTDFRIDAVLRALGYLGSYRGLDYLTAQAISVILSLFTLLYRPTRLAGIAVLGIFAGAVAVVMWNGKGADWMPYHRLMTPAIAPLAVGAALGIRSIFFHHEQAPVPSAVFTLVLFSLCIVSAHHPLKVEVSSVLYPQVKEIGQRLSELKRPGDVVASDTGGILPYYWGIEVIDTVGLCDSYLARHGKLLAGIGKTELVYVAEQQPTFYVFTYPSGAAGLYRNPLFSPYRDDYYLLKWPWQYYGKRLAPITLLVRKDRPDVHQFAAALGGTLLDPEAELRRTGFLPKCRLSASDRIPDADRIP